MIERKSLISERAELVSAIEAATSRGAAVGARSERIKEIDQELHRLAAQDQKPVANDDLLERLQSCVSGLEELETLPRPYDLYYAIKNGGQGTGWTYASAGIGVTDLRSILDRLVSPPPAANAGAEAITEADIRAHAGSGMVSMQNVIDAVNAILADRANAEVRLRDELKIAREVRTTATLIASGHSKDSPEYLRWKHHADGADEVAYKIEEALSARPHASDCDKL